MFVVAFETDNVIDIMARSILSKTTN